MTQPAGSSWATVLCKKSIQREYFDLTEYEPSVGSRGDSCDNALVESIIGLHKTEVTRRRGPWRGREDVEFATLERVHWYNTQRLLDPIGNVSPVEYEMNYYRSQEGSLEMARLN